MIIKRLVDGADERLEATSFIKRNLRKVFPDHWSFMLGELALYSFVMLLLTGTFLAFFYVASPDTTTYTGPYLPMQGRTVSLAYESVLRITFEVRAGLVMRQTHHWAALLFTAAMIAHLVRVFFTGAFRKPREFSWAIGVGLLASGIGAGFTGYSLPDDLLSGTGLRIAYSAVQSIPFIGTWLAFLFFGGEFPGTELLPRLLVLHIFLIPAVLATLIGVHLALVWHQTHTEFRGPDTTEDTVTGTPVWPKFALKATGLAFVTFGVLTLLGGLFQINPVWLYGPFVPYTASSPSQPDFYAGWLEGLLRLWPNWEFHVFGHTIGELFLPGVVIPGLIFAALWAWPFVEARVKHDRAIHHYAQRPREEPVRSGIGAGGIAFFVLLMLAGANDVVAKFLQIEVDTFNTILKILIFVVPVVAGFITWWVCRDLHMHDERPIAEPARARFTRNPKGGFDESHEPPGTERSTSERESTPS